MLQGYRMMHPHDLSLFQYPLRVGTCCKNPPVKLLNRHFRFQYPLRVGTCCKLLLPLCTPNADGFSTLCG